LLGRHTFVVYVETDPWKARVRFFANKTIFVREKMSATPQSLLQARLRLVTRMDPSAPDSLP
jgi:hypothetical protein